MQFLVDVCVGRPTDEWLREQGHGSAFVGDRNYAMIDAEILAWAKSDGRIVVTCDKDFGRMSAYEKLPHSGILLIPALRWPARIALLTQILAEHADELKAGAFITVRGNRVRIRKA